MQQIKLTERLYKKVKHRADLGCYKSVDEYVADILTDELNAEPESVDHLFTPERLAHIDKVIADIKAGGKTYTMEEVQEHLAKRRGEWIRKNGK